MQSIQLVKRPGRSVTRHLAKAAEHAESEATMAAESDASPGVWLTSANRSRAPRMPTSTPMTDCARQTPVGQSKRGTPGSPFVRPRRQSAGSSMHAIDCKRSKAPRHSVAVVAQQASRAHRKLAAPPPAIGSCPSLLDDLHLSVLNGSLTSPRRPLPPYRRTCQHIGSTCRTGKSTGSPMP